MMASAVKYCIQMDAASTGVRPGGAGSRLFAGTIAFSRIHAVLAQPEVRHDAHALAHLETLHARAERLDDAHAFIADERRQLRDLAG